jgi:hypothetical protein
MWVLKFWKGVQGGKEVWAAVLFSESRSACVCLSVWCTCRLRADYLCVLDCELGVTNEAQQQQQHIELDVVNLMSNV